MLTHEAGGIGTVAGAPPEKRRAIVAQRLIELLRAIFTQLMAKSALTGAGNQQAFLGAGHPHIKQPGILRDACLIIALAQSIHAYQNHAAEFQPLAAVNCQ